MILSFKDIRYFSLFIWCSFEERSSEKMTAIFETCKILFYFLFIRLSMIPIDMYYMSLYSERPQDQNEIQQRSFSFSI